MRGPHLRPTIKPVVAVLCAASFLTMSLGSVSGAFAEDTWQTWPRKKTVPGVAPSPAAEDTWQTWPRKKTVPGVAPSPAADADRAVEPEDTAGKKAAKGKSSRTIWWIAAGAAVAIGIGIAIAAGGDGGGGPTPNPGHQ